MSFDRYILNRRNLDMDAANFWMKNRTRNENINDYLHNTPIAKQDVNYSKKLRYTDALGRILNIPNGDKILSSASSTEKFVNQENWPVNARSKPVHKPRLAALDLPNIRNDISCNVLHWSSNNHIVAALKKMIYLWDVRSSTMTKSLKCNYDVIALKMNMESSILAFASAEADGCEIKFWNLKSSNVIQFHNPLSCAHTLCYITCIEYHPSNKYVILGCKKGNIAVKTISMEKVTTTKNAHNSLDVIKIKCSSDGRYVASTGYDGFIQVWKFPHLELIYSHKESYCSRGISWHPWKNSLLCIGTTNGTLSLINASSGCRIAHVKNPVSIIYDISFNKTSAELVTSHAFYELDSEPVTYKSQINVLANFHCVVDRFEGHCRRVLFLEWSPDNRILASAGSDETIHLWKFFDKTRKNSELIEHERKSFNLESFIR